VLIASIRTIQQEAKGNLTPGAMSPMNAIIEYQAFASSIAKNTHTPSTLISLKMACASPMGSQHLKSPSGKMVFKDLQMKSLESSKSSVYTELLDQISQKTSLMIGTTMIVVMAGQQMGIF